MILSSRELLNEAEDLVCRTKHVQYGIWGRVTTTVLNSICNQFLVPVNHEVHGHGFRALSLGVPISHYSFNLLGLEGATHFIPSFTQEPFAVKLDKSLLITMGGCEASHVLARELLFKNFKNLTLDFRTYKLFFNAYNDFFWYILVTSFSETVRNSSGNDIVAYVEDIYFSHNMQGVGLPKLAKGSLVLWLNPVYYVALWTFLDYLLTGKSSAAIPHLKLGSVNYMPLIRMGLTPFGPTYYLESYIGHGNKTFLVSIDSGISPGHTRRHGGVQLRTSGLWTYKSYSLDVTGHLWYQPRLQLKNQDRCEAQNYWGGLVGIDNKCKLGKHISLHVSILYKSSGFLEGVVANGGFVFRGGFSLHH